MFKRVFLLSTLISVVLSVNAQKQSLDYYIEKALQNSPLLKDYQNQIASSGVDSLLIRATQKIQADVTSQLTYAPVVSGWGYDEAITNGANIVGLMGIKQEIMNKKVLETRFKGLDIQKQAVANSVKISVNDVKKSVTNQFLTAYGDYNDIEFSRGQLKIMNDQLAILKRLTENGVYKQSDYLSLLAEIQAQEMLITQLTGQYASDIQLLNQLCGINDNRDVELGTPSLSEIQTVNPGQSPLFMQFKIDSIKIENEKKAIADEVKPKLNWFADAGLTSSTISDVYRHFGVSAGLSLTVPIYDGGQRKLETQKLTLSENTRSSYQSFFKSQYEQQIYQLYGELSNLAKVDEQVKKQLATSKDLIGITRTQLSNGTIPITDYLNALRNHTLINRMINQNEIKRLLLINELNYLKQQ
ncbi:MAG: TolC family protein [Bacteroidota bacterium]|nr:TolC family protein [Bacteroidota bacterium]